MYEVCVVAVAAPKTCKVAVAYCSSSILSLLVDETGVRVGGVTNEDGNGSIRKRNGSVRSVRKRSISNGFLVSALKLSMRS